MLKVACMLSAGYPDVRKYYRSLALPPITDVKVRPEEGDSPKAVLCRLLTSSDSTLSVMVAEFLFILCKESGELHLPYCAVHCSVNHFGYFLFAIFCRTIFMQVLAELRHIFQIVTFKLQF